MFELKKIEAEWRARMHKALSFDGVDDYVGVSNSASLDSPHTTGEMTVAIWANLKYDSAHGHHKLVHRPPYRFYVQNVNVNNARILWQINIDGSIYNVYSDMLQVWNEWHFYVGVFNGTDAIIFLDGVEVKREPHPGTPDSSAEDLWVSYPPAYPCLGLIAHVSIYNRALSESEIKYLYHNPFDPIDPEHLVLWLNPAGIDVANSKWWDLSGKGNHGTIYGATEVKLVEEEVKVK